MSSRSDMMRTAKLNGRGQLVIPEEMRAKLGLKDEEVLVLLQRGDEIILRREEDVLAELEGFWSGLSRRALERAWDEEDESWEEHYEGNRP